MRETENKGTYTHGKAGTPDADLTGAIISDYMRRLTVPPHNAGFSYIKYALELILADESFLYQSASAVNRAIGERFGIAPKRVEYSIRTAVSRAWERGAKKVFIDDFKYRFSSGSRLRSGEFLAVAASEIRGSLMRRGIMPAGD